MLSKIAILKKYKTESFRIERYGEVIADFACSRFSFFRDNMNKDAPYCKCGCNKKVTWNKRTKKWNKYIVWHYSKTEKFKKEIRKRTVFNDPEFHKKQSERLKGNQYRKGIKHTKKTREFLSKRLLSLGDKHWMKSPKHRKRMSENNYFKTDKFKRWFKENNPSKRLDVKKKQSETKLGNKNPAKRPEVRKKISKTLTGKYCGPNSPNWKDGRSFEPYCSMWGDKEYKQSIKDRDNNECQNKFDCWKTNARLHIHHIDSDKKNCRPSNLITVCVSCNARAQGSKKQSKQYWINFYQNIMIKKYGYKYKEK